MNCQWVEKEEKERLVTIYKCSNCGYEVTVRGDRMPPERACRGKKKNGEIPQP